MDILGANPLEVSAQHLPECTLCRAVQYVPATHGGAATHQVAATHVVAATHGVAIAHACAEANVIAGAVGAQGLPAAATHGTTAAHEARGVSAVSMGRCKPSGRWGPWGGRNSWGRRGSRRDKHSEHSVKSLPGRDLTAPEGLVEVQRVPSGAALQRLPHGGRGGCDGANLRPEVDEAHEVRCQASRQRPERAAGPSAAGGAIRRLPPWELPHAHAFRHPIVSIKLFMVCSERRPRVAGALPVRARAAPALFATGRSLTIILLGGRGALGLAPCQQLTRRQPCSCRMRAVRGQPKS